MAAPHSHQGGEGEGHPSFGKFSKQKEGTTAGLSLLDQDYYLLLVASRRSDAFFFHLPLGRLGSPPPNFACFFLSEGNFNKKGGKRKSIRIRKGERRNFFLPSFFSRIPLFHHAILESVHASGNASRRNTRKLSVVLDRFRHYSAAHRHIVSSRRGKIIGSCVWNNRIHRQFLRG